MIRKAIITDAKSIYAVFANNVLDRARMSDFAYQEYVQKEGFILGSETEGDFKNYISEYPYFFVHENKGKILGFLCANNKRDYLDDEYKFWLDENAKNIYYNNQNSSVLDMVVVDKNQHTHGIGSKLLKYFEKQLTKDGYRYLFSIVRFLPLTNCASILFHTKHRFSRVASSKPRPLYGVENAASFLYYKELNK